MSGRLCRERSGRAHGPSVVHPDQNGGGRGLRATCDRHLLTQLTSDACFFADPDAIVKVLEPGTVCRNDPECREQGRS